MSNSIAVHMFAKYWNIYIFIICGFLATVVGMDQQDNYKTCEDFACENSNACHSSLINGTMTSNAYCICRGEWVGLRCEVKLLVSAVYVTTERAAIQMRGVTSSGRGKMLQFKDLYISEMSVSVWNLNTSDHCLLLQQSDPTESVIELGSLIKDQEYIACVTNGFVDSCSFFSNWPMNTSSSTNCIYFKTRLFNESPFDIGFAVVPCAVFIFILIFTFLIYNQRHSLLVQLCLNKVFCRSCYCCRKRILRKRRHMHRQRDTSGEGLMTPDLPLDFESIHEDSSHRWRHSSNASSLTSRRSASYSIDEESMALPVSLDHNTFLYEDQSLIPPLYSPQDHKVMTLTYIEEDFISQNAEQCSYNSQVISLPETDNSTRNDKVSLQEITASSVQQFHIPVPVSHEITENHVSASNHIQSKPEPCQTIGPVKPLYWNHPYLHRPYDKHHLFQHQFHPNRPRNRITNSKCGVRYRESNGPLLHQRPCSMPLQETTDKPATCSTKSDSNNLKHPHNAHLKHSHESFLSPLSSWSTIFPPTNNHVKSVFGTNPTTLKRLLSSPSRYKSILKRESHGTITRQSRGCEGDGYTSNTLPRSRKPKFDQTWNSFHNSGYELKSDKLFLSVLPHTSNNIPNIWLGHNELINVTLPQQLSIAPDSLHKNQSRTYADHVSFLPHSANTAHAPWFSYDDASNASPNTSPALQNPTWLGYQTKNKDQHLDIQSQSSCSNSPDTPSTSQSKSYVKSLISHFEHNLSFLKSSKSHHPTDEEKEFRDLKSPLAEERSKVSKKSRRSHFNRPLSRDTPALINQNYRHSLTSGVKIFEGHPSEHILLPFATDDEDDDEDVTETSTLNDISDETLSTSLPSGNRQNAISSFDDDNSNLVTPFVTDDSSDDDTYKGINSLSGSMETLQDDNIEVQQPS